jgi:hypothetical protein
LGRIGGSRARKALEKEGKLEQVEKVRGEMEEALAWGLD